jgi:hypothetical protein
VRCGAVRRCARWRATDRYEGVPRVLAGATLRATSPERGGLIALRAAERLDPRLGRHRDLAWCRPGRRQAGDGFAVVHGSPAGPQSSRARVAALSRGAH